MKVLLEDGGKGGDRTSLEKLVNHLLLVSERTDRRAAVSTPTTMSVVIAVVEVPLRAHVGHRVDVAGGGVRRRLHGLTLPD